MAIHDSVRNVYYLYDQFGKIRTVEFYLQKHSKRICFDVDRIIVRENDAIEYKLNLDQESDQYNQIVYLYFKNSKVLLLNHKVLIFYGHLKVYFYTVLISLFLIWWLCFSFRFFAQLIYDGMIFWKDAVFIRLEIGNIFMLVLMGVLFPMMTVYVAYKEFKYLNLRNFLREKDKNHNNYEYYLNIFERDKKIYFLGKPKINEIVQLKAQVSDFFIVTQPIQLAITAGKTNTKGMGKKKKAKLRQQHHLDQHMAADKLLPLNDGFRYQYFFDTDYKNKNHICWQEVRIIVDRDFTLKGMIPKDILILHYFSHSKELILAQNDEYFYLNPKILKEWRENDFWSVIKVISVLTLFFVAVMFVIILFVDIWLSVTVCLTMMMIAVMCAIVYCLFKLYIFMKSNIYTLFQQALNFNFINMLRFLLFPKHFQIYSSLPFVNEENRKNWFLRKPKRPEN